MHRARKLFLFSASIVLLISLNVCHAQRSGEEMQQILIRLNSLKTAEEKIAYLEEQSRKNRDHLILYNLASLYLMQGDDRRAEILLREDLAKNREPFDAYESYSLLIGIAVDQKRKIEESDIETYTQLFHQMRKDAAKRIARIERSLARIAGREDKDSLQKEEQIEELEEQKRALEAYGKDPFQFERMIADFYYEEGNLDKAQAFYENFYKDLDKPVDSFLPQSMRNYVDILLKQNRRQEALLFMGYIINLKPNMFDDLFNFSRLYYETNDRISALLILMFIDALSEGSDTSSHQRSRDLILQLRSELGDTPEEKKLFNLTDIYLSGKNIGNIPYIIDGLRAEGVQNFFFHYLEGIHFFLGKNYGKALNQFMAFNDIYPYLADSYYYSALCMYNLNVEEYNERIIVYAEMAVELKPDSGIGRIAKQTIGRLLGLSEDESDKIVVGAEIDSVMSNFIEHGAPVSSLDKLIDLLTVQENPYQTAVLQLLSEVSKREDELASYLKKVYGRLNRRGKENIEHILLNMGRSVD